MGSCTLHTTPAISAFTEQHTYPAFQHDATCGNETADVQDIPPKLQSSSHLQSYETAQSDDYRSVTRTRRNAQEAGQKTGNG